MKKNNFFLASYYFPSNNGKNDNLNSYMSGPSVDLYDYLLKKEEFENIIFFRFPLLTKKRDKKLIVQGRINKEKFFDEFPVKTFVNYQSQHQSILQTFVYKLSECYYLFKVFKKYSGLEFNCIWTTESVQLLTTRILFKKKKNLKIIYDVIDYSPRRFPSRIKNSIFHFLDRFSCKLSSFSVVQTERIIRYRKRKNLINDKQLIKPTGIQRKFFVNSKTYDKNNIVYAGILSETEGLDLILDNFLDIIKINPKIKFNIIGTSQDENYMNKFIEKINDKKVKNYIEYLGPMYNKYELSDFLSKQGLAVALYNRKNKEEISNKFFNSVNKLHMYGAACLPIMTTSIPLFSKNIKNHDAGYVISYNKQDLLKSLTNYFLLSDANYYNLRKRSYELSKNYNWEKIFNDIFTKIGIY